MRNRALTNQQTTKTYLIPLDSIAHSPNGKKLAQECQGNQAYLEHYIQLLIISNQKLITYTINNNMILSH